MHPGNKYSSFLLFTLMCTLNQRSPFLSFPNALILPSQTFYENQKSLFSEHHRTVSSERYSNLLNFSLGVSFLAILEDLISKIFLRVGPTPMSLNLICSPTPDSISWRHLYLIHWCDSMSENFQVISQFKIA